MDQLILFSGTMLAGILGAAAGAAVGAGLDGWLTARFSNAEKAKDEGWAVTSVVRGALLGTLPGLLVGGYFGFVWLVDWLGV